MPGAINLRPVRQPLPTGALTERDDTPQIWRAIEDPDKIVVIQTAARARAPPSASASAWKPGTPMTFQMNTALKRCGFDKVFGHQLFRGPDDPGRRRRTDFAPLQGGRAQGQQGGAAANSPAAHRAGSKIHRTLLPGLSAASFFGQGARSR